MKPPTTVKRRGPSGRRIEDSHVAGVPAPRRDQLLILTVIVVSLVTTVDVVIWSPNVTEVTPLINPTAQNDYVERLTGNTVRGSDALDGGSRVLHLE